jgi:hypothetical protein
MGGVQGPEGRSARGRSEDDEKDQEARWEHWCCIGGTQGWEPGDDLADIPLRSFGVVDESTSGAAANQPWHR